MRVKVLLTLVLTLTTFLTGFGQSSNPYKLDDEVYSYYQRCMPKSKSPVIIAMSDTMFNLAARKKDVKGQCIALNLKTRYYLTVRNIDSITYHKEKVQRFAARTPYTAYVFSAWNCLLQYYLDLADYSRVAKEAEAYQQEAIRLKSDYGIGQSYRVLGEIYTSTHDYRQAIAQLEKGAAYYEQKKDPNLYECYNSLSNCYFQLGNYAQAEYYALLSEKSCTVRTLQTTARIYLLQAACKLKDVDKANRYMHDLVALRTELHHFFPTGEVRFAEASIEYYLLKKEYGKALAWTDSLSRVSPAYRYKALVLEQMGNYKEALVMQRRNQQMVDSLRDAQAAEQTALYAQRFDNIKLSAEKEQLALQNTQYRLSQLTGEHRLLAAAQLQNELTLQNNELELNNKDLLITQHANQLKLRNAQMAKEKQEKAHLRVLAQQQTHERNMALGAAALMVLLAIILFFARSRYTLRLLKEKERAEHAYGEADKARAEAEAARAEATKANDLKTLFIQNMNHEIRTPLNAIVGFSGLMSDETIPPEEKKEFASLVQLNSDLLTALVDDIMNLSNFESGTYEVKPEWVDVEMICAQAYEQAKYLKRPEVSYQLDLGDKPLALYTDMNCALKVLFNLLTNAFKNTSMGSVRLHCREVMGMIELVVTDTGCGIPEDKAELIFERFSKLDAFAQGTGLGLSVCQLICAYLHGSIRLNTDYKDGAEFVFALPAGEQLKEEVS